MVSPASYLPASYLNIVRASAWYDLVVMIGFVTPWTFAAVLAGLQQLASALGMPGTFPPFAPEHTMMANLLGSLVMVWAVLRLADTQVRYGRYDAAARFLFAAWQLYALAHGAHPIIWLFFVMELLFGMAQAWPLRDMHPAR